MATLVFGLGLMLAVGFGCGTAAPAASGKIELGPLPTVAIEWDLPNMTIDHWANAADGLSTSISPALGAGAIEPGETVTGAVPFQFSPEAVTGIRTLRFDTWETRKTERPIVLIEWGE